VFEPDAHDMLEKAGYDITPYIAEHQRAASVFLRHRRTIQREQRKLWWDDFRELLTQSLRRAFRRYTQDHF
jgi:ABC-type transporter MlaC component